MKTLYTVSVLVRTGDQVAIADYQVEARSPGQARAKLQRFLLTKTGAEDLEPGDLTVVHVRITQVLR